MRREKEEEEDAKSREGRGGMAMGEPHAWRGRQARTRSLRIPNVRQKEKREIKAMPRRGEDNPRKTHGNSYCGGLRG